MRRLLLRSLALGVTVLTTCVLTAVPASAHGDLVEGSPGPGDEVAVGTTVLQIKEIPQRPPRFNGALCLFGLTADADEATIRKGLEEFGEITSCVIASRDGHMPTVVRFATHEAAEAALEGAKWSVLCAAVDTLYNERPYDERGW